MADPLFIGIDGGGTNCRARLRDAAGRALGEGRGGPANLRLGTAAVMGSVLAACRAALTDAGLSEADLGRAHVGLGLAGAIGAGAGDAFLAGHPFASATLESDAYTAWLGAFRGGPGAILIVGTGSCGFGVFGGRPVQIGGWGNVISDEGSGGAIGREAVRRAVQALDGRAPATPLSDAILNRFDRRPEAIVAFADAAKPADFAALVPLVLDHAGAGDPLGRALVADAAADIAGIAERLLALGAPRVALLGGLAEPLRPHLPPEIAARLAAPASDAMDGAILMAQQALARR
ncbi:MAG TPA: BadF/BadG/BcrA/BcrD ATPase family protein [Microvirga sp.]|jgi:glucosamine kinase|nr:BadF/BadG/BcrA/BcrD ATPase family protein [Microvirga sp.]